MTSVIIEAGEEDVWKNHPDDIVIKRLPDYVIRLCPHDREVYIQTVSIAYYSYDGRTYYMTSGGKISAGELGAIVSAEDIKRINDFWRELGMKR